MESPWVSPEALTDPEWGGSPGGVGVDAGGAGEGGAGEGGAGEGGARAEAFVGGGFTEEAWAAAPQAPSRSPEGPVSPFEVPVDGLD